MNKIYSHPLESAEIPLRSSQLTRKERKSTNYKRHYRGIYLPKDVAPNAITNARTEHLRFPTAIVGGWAALHYRGLPYWRDTEPVTVHSGKMFGRVDGRLRVVEKQCPYDLNLDPYFPDLLVAEKGQGVVDCLADIRERRSSWWVPRVDDLSLEDIRAIQLIDAARHFCGVTLEEVQGAALHCYSAREIARLWSRSSSGAHSPYESSVRLIVSDLAPGLATQVLHFRENEWGESILVTVSDLAWEHLRIALFYDGRHHLDEGVRSSDAEKRLFLQTDGWVVIGVTSEMLGNPKQLRHRVEVAIEKQKALLKVGCG